MSWTAQASDKYFEDGQLCIVVDYSDGTDMGQGNFIRVYRQGVPQDDVWLQTTIDTELARVEALQTWSETIEVS